MSVSTLIQMESCPKQWAQRNAHYPAVWDGRGYPPRPHLRAIEGRIVHETLRTLLGAFLRNGCTGLNDPRAVATLRELGGLTAVIEVQTRSELAAFAANPRAQRPLPDVTRRVLASAPALRTTVQLLLRRISLPGAFVPIGESSPSLGRHALALGLYREVTLEVPALGWRGTVDLLNLAPDGCGIVEFKTGAPSEDHVFQVRAYAVLWRDATDLNHAGVRANRLTLSYPASTIEVAGPSDAEIETLRDEMQQRAVAARASVATPNPEARIDVEKCRYCDVRHMCEAYWVSTIPGLPATGSALIDIEVRLNAKVASRTWTASMVAPRWQGASPVLVTFVRDGECTVDGLHPGITLRILGAILSVDMDDEVRQTVVVTTNSEIFAR
jgi:hypothetical protein